MHLSHFPDISFLCVSRLASPWTTVSSERYPDTCTCTCKEVLAPGLGIPRPIYWNSLDLGLGRESASSSIELERLSERAGQPSKLVPRVQAARRRSRRFTFAAKRATRLARVPIRGRSPRLRRLDRPSRWTRCRPSREAVRVRVGRAARWTSCAGIRRRSRTVGRGLCAGRASGDAKDRPRLRPRAAPRRRTAR